MIRRRARERLPTLLATSPAVVLVGPLLTFTDGEQWAVEIKRSLAPKPERGFHHASSDLNPARRFVVYPGRESYALAPTIEAVGVRELGLRLLNRAGG